MSSLAMGAPARRGRGRLFSAILQPDSLHDVFSVHASVIRGPHSGKPLFLAHRSAERA